MKVGYIIQSCVTSDARNLLQVHHVANHRMIDGGFMVSDGNLLNWKKYMASTGKHLWYGGSLWVGTKESLVFLIIMMIGIHKSSMFLIIVIPGTIVYSINYGHCLVWFCLVLLWLYYSVTYILMSHNMIILYIRLPYFHVSNSFTFT